MNRAFSLCLATAMLVFLGTGTVHATEIWSTAQAQWATGRPDDLANMASNSVVVKISDEVSFSLLDETSVLASPGSGSTMPHRAQNHGAKPIDLTFDVWNQSGDGFDLEDVHLFLDTNHNGRIDEGEPEIPRGSHRAFTAGEQINILAWSVVPDNAQDHATAFLVISATEATTGAVINRVDTVKIRPEGAGLLVEKIASRNEAEVGETVSYTVRVRNATAGTLMDATLFDDLPAGFSYEPGSLRIDAVFTPFVPVRGGSLEIDLPKLISGAITTISYRVRIGPVALRGDGINRAHASASGTESNLATARVLVREGVFTSNGVILGRVFSDKNGNGQPDAGETGLPGVRLYLEDGTYIITDADGKYSFYGVTPRTHILKLDRSSLPAGSQIKLNSFRQAGDASSRFIELKRSELHRADFALQLTPDGLDEISSRRTALKAPIEIERELSSRLTADGKVAAISDRKALAAAGIVTPVVDTPIPGLPASPSTSKPTQSKSKEETSEKPAAISDDVWMAAITDNTLGFVGLSNGQILPTGQTDLVVKGTLGAKFTLAVNGAIIDEDRVGTKATIPDCNAEAWKFIGLNLAPGENRLRVNLLDPFGNPRGSETITVLAPGKLAVLKVSVSDTVADGTSPARVTVELRDARGTPVTARTPVTLQSSVGTWQTDDLDPTSPGVQVFIEGGRQVFLLTSPLQPGECEIMADSGTIHAQNEFSFEPNLRPMIAAGVIEGSLSFGSRARGELLPTSNRDAFEEELRGLSNSSFDGRLGAGGRAALFLKGKVRGDFLLTAAYDSDKPSNTQLFRDIQPGEYYPVYGDASVRGYDAQSTGKLYVRIDRNRSYALLGDFTTSGALGPQQGDLRTLGNYQRSLSGAKEHFENSRVRANLWASQDSTSQVVAELPANGTSGPYAFSFNDILVNSERVELVTRDRNQPSKIISVQSMARFADYEFEPFTGRLLFTAPVASVDRDLNPIAIRVTAETEQNGAKFWTYGGDAQVKLNNRVEVGASYARDENPANRYELASVGAAVKLAAPTTLTAEAAASRSDVDGEGLAGRVELTHRTERTDAQFYLGRTDPKFSNPGALLLPGRLEGGYKLTQKLAASTSLISQGLITEDLVTGGRRLGARVDVERAFGAYRVAFGFRHSEETAAPAGISTAGVTPNTIDSLRLKFTSPLPKLKQGTGYLEYERDVRDADKQVAAAGFDYNFASGGRAYARHEFISALGGAFELNDQQRNRTTLIGLEKSYMKGGQLFNEYRASNEIAGREAEAALGLRNLWRLTDGVNASTSFERVTPIEGDRRNESTAVTANVTYARDPRWRANSRIEFRWSPSTDSILNTFGYARQLNTDWTYLGKSILLLTDLKGPSGGQTVQGRLQSGFAWRPSENTHWNSLGKYELKYESDSRAIALVSHRLTQMIVVDLNYQPDTHWATSLHYAGKWVEENGTTGNSDLFAHLVSTRCNYQFAKRWDARMNLSLLCDGHFQQARYSVGPELGFIAHKNLELAAGYNFTGFRDRDLASDGTSAQGFFIRMRLKFDESLLAGLGKKTKS